MASGAGPGVAYAVTELLEGETLRAKLEGGALPARKAVEDALQIVHGIAAAHQKGIVHRDLKPENVFVTQDGRVKILDFGLAKATGPMGDATATHVATGTSPGTVMGTVGSALLWDENARMVGPRCGSDQGRRRRSRPTASGC